MVETATAVVPTAVKTVVAVIIVVVVVSTVVAIPGICSSNSSRMDVKGGVGVTATASAPVVVMVAPSTETVLVMKRMYLFCVTWLVV